MTTWRVLVSGSRTWPWPGIVDGALAEQRARLGPGDVMVVVVGYDPDRRYPPGVDEFAYTWATQHRDNPNPALAAVAVESHPADWKTHSKAAGGRRNGV